MQIANPFAHPIKKPGRDEEIQSGLSILFYPFKHMVWCATGLISMGTFIRAAASVETSLRDSYAKKKGHVNLSQLRQDPGYKKNIFQRIMPWHGNDGAIALLATVNVDITAIPELPTVQELVLHRHLYAHNLGVIDDEYIKNLKRLTAVDLQADPNVASQYPAQDVFWFEPLSRLPVFIEAVRSFVRALP